MHVLAGVWRRLPLAAHSQIKGIRHTRGLRLSTVFLYSTQVPSSDVSVHYNHGLPVITLPLPSRKERCQFTVKPLTTSVGKFLKDIQNEDRGIDIVSAVSADGTKFSSSTLMDVLLRNEFQLVINNSTYHVQPPPRETPLVENSNEMNSIKSLVHSLYATLHSEEHCLKKEQELLQKLDDLKEELQPLEEMKANIMAKSDAKTTRLMWIGLALLSTQGGALAWLTWWVYSWDIMEPVTYFITYGSAIAFYAYFALTKEDYVYPVIRDRQFLHYFYRRAKSQRFDVEKYNKLRDEFAETEEHLKRLRNPLQLKLPIEQLREKE
ncbi:calcium uniporter regulatory subunit MCUb, mitochondrial [Spea bombifrons]|uniref:calcium uniporter regulatory subunit MCUb, mitochondrial n=1 Tax=Spea bombifrons TaxID=233779 RepID=UPI00234AAB44|nr:calcium uniporter regulatory subunit MCUb, mitochondrial [Spea bombifrons]